jgi:hypothetical protein
MSDKPESKPPESAESTPPESSKPEQERISELEAEVARLRQRLGEEGAASGDGEPGDGASSGNGASSSEGDGSTPAKKIDAATRSRMIAVGLIVLVAALAIFSVVFFVLSKGFTSFANKAAQVIMPGSGSAQGSSAPSDPVPPPEPPERETTPRAPGL